MRLRTAFGIQDKDVVAFVGGGGKSGAMFRLAQELVTQGKRVVTTTTTRIFAAQINMAPQSLRLAGTLDRERVRQALTAYPHLLVIGATTAEGKALGVDPAIVDELIEMVEVDAVLVEADGSRMRPFKAPSEHEPVIPASTTLLVPVVGMDVLGKPLNGEHVHRPEIVAGILGAAMGTILDEGHIARVLADARGGLKNKTTHARVIPLLNKVETTTQMAMAQTIAGQLLEHAEIDGVAIGAIKNDESPVALVSSRVSAVILAAGGSTRMRGETKQLLPWRGTTMIGNAVRTAKQSRVAEIVVVTGNQHERIAQEIAAVDDIQLTRNRDWASGRASSVCAGIAALSPASSAAIFINADQPFLTAAVIDTILAKFLATRAPIVVPVFAGKPASPVLFARELFGELCALRGEQGGRDLLQKYKHVLVQVEIADERAALDLDTPEDYMTALDQATDNKSHPARTSAGD